MIQKSVGERVFDVFNITILVLLSIACLYPLLYVLFASFSDPGELAQVRGFLFGPKGFTLEAYKRVFANPTLGSAYLNTVFYVVVGTAVNIFLTSLGAYGLSRKNVMFSTPLMLMIVFSMYFSGGVIPLYLLVGDLGLLNTRWAMILPGAISAYNLIIMRTSFLGIPDSYEESARMDGANDFTILFRVILPLSLPVIAVMVLFYGVGHWNQYFNAMIFLQSRDLYPLQLLLREILIANDTSSMTTGVGAGDAMPIGETIKYATIVVATVPILALYPFLQKYFVKGVMIGGIKG